MDQQNAESLHEQASEHYLHGRFREAIEAWRRLLQIDPGDERAAEGLRLAGIMADGEASTGVDAADTPADPPTTGDAGLDDPFVPAPEAPPPPEASAPDLDFDLSALDSLGAPADERAQAAAAGTPDPQRQGDGLDLGDADAESIPLGAEVPHDQPRRGLDGIADMAADDADADAEAVGLEPVDDASSVAPPPRGAVPVAEGEAAVEDQLRRRVAELVREAQTAADEGRREDALGILSRVSILDEENEQALHLEETLRQQMGQEAQEIDHWLTEGVQWLEQGRIDDAVERFERVLARAPGHMEATSYLEQARGGSGESPRESAGAPQPDSPADAPALDEAGPAGDSIALASPEPDIPLAAAPPETETDRAPAHTVALPSAPIRRRAGRPVALAAALAVVVLAAGAVWWLGLLPGGGGAPRDPGVSTAAPVTPAEGLAGAPSGLAPSDPSGTDSGAAAPTRALDAIDRADRVERAMARASEALGQGDYGEAILAYNEVLAVDPANDAARLGLLEAGDAYRRIKALEDQLNKARIAFEEGEYTAALRLYYRMPAGAVDPAVIERYKFNGWYNLAVLSLQAGDTRHAREHLDEALTLRQDPVAARMLVLAKQYDGRIKDRAYYMAVNDLPIRGLDD